MGKNSLGGRTVLKNNSIQLLGLPVSAPTWKELGNIAPVLTMVKTGETEDQ